MKNDLVQSHLLKIIQLNIHDLHAEKMHEIAHFIFSNFKMQGLNGEIFTITALEFYFYHPKLFLDSSSHRHAIQQTSGKLYIHTFKKEFSFKAPNRSGVDITCGSESEDIWGGILIRQLNGISGSSKACLNLIKGKAHLYNKNAKWSPEEITILKKIQGASIFDAPIKLITREKPVQVSIQKIPRIGIPNSTMAEALYHHKAIYQLEDSD